MGLVASLRAGGPLTTFELHQIHVLIASKGKRLMLKKAEMEVKNKKANIYFFVKLTS